MNLEVSETEFLKLQGFHPTKEAFVAAAKTWAKNLSFYLSIEKSDTNRVVMVCVRGGKKRATSEATITIKCNCPFKVTCLKLINGLWKASLTNAVHNHPPISASIAQGRQLVETQKTEVVRLHESLVAPRQIVSLLGLAGVVRTKDIYNTIQAAKKKKLEGRSPLHYLLDSFQQENCFVEFCEGDNQNLTNLFFAFPEQIEMFRRHNYVVMADCTYKTNRYKMPLLHFIGLTNVGKSFSVGFCFLTSEVKDDYIWALHAFSKCFGCHPKIMVTDQEDALINAASDVFPLTSHLLCIWHLNKNVLKNCKPLFPAVEEYNLFFNGWLTLVYSASEVAFENNYKQFNETWSLFPKALLYIQRNLYPLRFKFVLAWTNQFRHLGSTSTSRAEGLHAQIKKYIISSREDLLGVCTALKLALETQLCEIKITVENQKIANYYRFGSFFSKVKNKISVYALDMVLKQFQLQKPLNRCTDTFSMVYGIPCAHLLETKILNNEKLEVDDFFEHWKLCAIATDERNDLFEPLVERRSFESEVERIRNLAETGGENTTRSIAAQLERVAEFSGTTNPETVSSGRGRPVGSSNLTRRDPSSFEYVEGTHGLNRCRKCGVLGHNARTCTAAVVTVAAPVEGSNSMRRCGNCGMVGARHNSRTCPNIRPE